MLLKMSPRCFKIFCTLKTQKSKLALSRTVQKHDMPSILLLYSLVENLAKKPALRTKYNHFSESHWLVVFVIPALISPLSIFRSRIDDGLGGDIEY